MINVFSSVKSLVKLSPVCIDNNTFRLHYKVTVIILIAFSLIVTSKQHIGDPITCISDNVKNDKGLEKALNTYCWIQSTYTIPARFNGKKGVDFPHPGIGPQNEGTGRHYHSYYQWVCFVLFFQALFFYIPHYMWKIWEGGRIKALSSDLKNPILGEEDKTKKQIVIIDYFLSYLHKQNEHAYKFFICEVLNFINVIIQLYLMDLFFDGEFLNYGPRVLELTELEPEFRNDTMSTVFPKVTKCDFYKYGPSGSIQNYDILCILPLNIVNEKIYVFLWFWLVALSVISGLVLLYRVAILLIPQVRYTLLCIQSRLSDKNDFRTINKKFLVGDWFVLYQLGKNIDPMTYEELISSLSVSLAEGINIIQKIEDDKIAAEKAKKEEENEENTAMPHVEPLNG